MNKKTVVIIETSKLIVDSSTEVCKNEAEVVAVIKKTMERHGLSVPLSVKYLGNDKYQVLKGRLVLQVWEELQMGDAIPCTIDDSDGRDEDIRSNSKNEETIEKKCRDFKPVEVSQRALDMMTEDFIRSVVDGLFAKKDRNDRR